MPHDVDDVVQILHQVKIFVDSTQDLQAVAKAQESMLTKEAERETESEAIRSQLRTLSQSLAAARSAAVRPAEVPSAAEHSRKVNHMDGERFQLFKSIKEAEEKTETREAELARAREELKMLENRDVVDEVELDGVALRLKMCKDLGFDVVLDKDTGENKILVRSQSKEVHCVTLEDERSPFHYANQLWELSTS